MIEHPEVLQELRNECRIFRQLQAEDFRTIGLNLSAFHWIVVDKDKAIQTDLQFGGQGPEVFRFGTPINSAGHEMFGSQWHFGPALEYVANIFFVILAAKAKQLAGVVLPAEEFLEGLPRGI